MVGIWIISQKNLSLVSNVVKEESYPTHAVDELIYPV
jgi:hypothetical protein